MLSFARSGPDFCAEIVQSLDRYTVCLYRATGLDDRRHVEFSPELFDAGNLDADGNISRTSGDALPLAKHASHIVGWPVQKAARCSRS